MAFLQRNSKGDFVRDVQGLLWQSGLYDGRVDGIYGPKTEEAVKNWQDFVGAKPDGKWGAKTIAATSGVLASLNTQNSNLQNNMPVIPLVEKKRGM
jgi:peptidoglycan hydrolase-like protein with peptidoglycan-binding domain